MEKFRTHKQMLNYLREHDYKFLTINKNGTHTYWDSIGDMVIVDFEGKTIMDKR